MREASVPFKDFGGRAYKSGDVWRFLLCRTCLGAQPAPQASWSVTQGFSELGQHPPVKLMDDEAVVQFRNAASVCTGNYKFPVAVVAPQGSGADVTLELRWHKGPVAAESDKIEKQTLQLKAGERREIEFAGAVPDEQCTPDKKGVKRGYFSLLAKKADGTTLFRQSFPYAVTGWTPQPPVKMKGSREAKELDISAKYGPESNVLVLRADILDLPAREQVAGGNVRLIDPAQENKVLKTIKLPPFRNAYSNAHAFLDDLPIPVQDHTKVADVEERNRNIDRDNKVRVKEGKEALPLEKVDLPEPMTLKVEVTVEDKDGKALKSETAEIKLARSRFAWSGNEIGITDKVIPPWTPVAFDAGKVGVWNRSLAFDGLGLLKTVANGGVDQIKRMRLVAIQDGKEIEVTSSTPKLERQAEAFAEFSGGGQGAGLALRASTRVEFDGFVKSTLTIGPEDAKAGAKIDGLYWEVVLPESEATHFCTTAGGWAAVHDQTPAYWSSQQTGSGLLAGDFVPYVWLTNSDRGFLWVADNDKGWITDTDRSRPTQEIRRENGTVTLRVHFIELPVELKEPTTLVYAYQNFPSRPLPAGWRGTICAPNANFPGTRNTYFWFDGDWAVLWPYYCSPFPWSLEKSKTMFDRFPKDGTHHPMVGSIAHSIGRYLDYDKHAFNEYAVDWADTPGDLTNANTTQGRGPADFRVYHYQRWVREAGFRGLYVDENYLAAEKNFLTGGAYLKPDGRLQPGYSYLGEREYFKRMKMMFHENGVAAPNLWQHVSSGAAYHAWFGDVFFEGENVEPTDEQFDYMEVLPAGRMRAIGSSVCSGGVMTMMCQSQRHRTVFEPKHTHQFTGWVLAHDILPEQVLWYGVFAQEGRLYRDDVEFIGYWKPSNPLKTATPDCAVSIHKTGRRALAWIVNTAREDRRADVTVDWNALGIDRAACIALNAETGAEIPHTEKGFTVPVLKRDFVAVHLIETKQLPGGASFYASCDKGPQADASFGCDVLEPVQRAASGSALAEIEGVKDKALDGKTGWQIWPRLHVTDDEGRVSFQARVTANPKGAVFTTVPARQGKAPAPAASALQVNLDKKELTFSLANATNGADSSVHAPVPAAGWHLFEIAWKDGRAALKVDGKEIGAVKIAGLGVGSGIGPAMLESSRFQFGSPRSGAIDAIDELLCFRHAE